MGKVKKFWITNRRYGTYYMCDRVLVSLGVRKKMSHKSQLKRQQYYLSMNPEEYPAALKEWYHRVSGGRTLDLEHPKRFTEKIQWLKLYDSTPEKTRLADKYLVRDYVAEKIGAEYLIPLLGVWDNADEIDFDSLPDKFVLKCNHGSGTNILVRDKSKLNIPATRKLLHEWMETEYGMASGGFELHYNSIQKKIIAEAFLENSGDRDLLDYKFFCFHGKPVCIQVIGARSSGKTIDFFDTNWKHLSFTGLSRAPHATTLPEKPETFEKMKSFSETLSTGFYFVRVDFYEVRGHLYFGELTFTPASGSGSFHPDEVDFELGQLLHLPCDDEKEGE